MWEEESSEGRWRPSGASAQAVLDEGKTKPIKSLRVALKSIMRRRCHAGTKQTDTQLSLTLALFDWHYAAESHSSSFLAAYDQANVSYCLSDIDVPHCAHIPST